MAPAGHLSALHPSFDKRALENVADLHKLILDFLELRFVSLKRFFLSSSELDVGHENSP